MTKEDLQKYFRDKTHEMEEDKVSRYSMISRGLKFKQQPGSIRKPKLDSLNTSPRCSPMKNHLDGENDEKIDEISYNSDEE